MTAAGARPSMGDCDRQPCPPAGVGDLVSVELDQERRTALGVTRIDGRVVDVSPFLHAMLVDGRYYVGGHRSTDVITRTAR